MFILKNLVSLIIEVYFKKIEHFLRKKCRYRLIFVGHVPGPTFCLGAGASSWQKYYQIKPTKKFSTIWFIALEIFTFLVKFFRK
jgi:hypothetical protein